MLHNRYIRNKVNRIVVNKRIDTVLTSITGQGFFQVIFRHIQIFGHLIAILAVMLESTDNSAKSDEAIISPQTGVQFLLSAACILQISDVSDAGKVMPYFFCKNGRLLSGGLQLRIQCDMVIYVKTIQPLG